MTDIESRLAILEDWHLRVEQPAVWLERKIATLKIDGVESIRAELGDSFYGGDPCIHVRVVVADKLSSDHAIRACDEIRKALDPLNRFVNMRTRSVSENEKLSDGGW